MRGRAAGMGGAAALAATVLALVPGAADASARCQRRGARTLRQTQTARIYVLSSRHEVYACWRASGSTVAMGRQEVNSTGEERVEVSSLISAPATGSSPSSIVAWRTSALGGVFSFEQLVSANLRTGRVIHRSDAEPPPGYSGPEDATVQSFIVTPAGSLAWVGASAFTACDGVHDIGADGVQHDLDCSPAAAVAKLTWAAGVLSWSDAGTTLTAALS